jgi:ubiquinone/menaquinone biosynthesis C-methylase UbiE
MQHGDTDISPPKNSTGRYPEGEETIADLGSGTGFYTDDVAPAVDQVYAVDIQESMHEYYREKGVPDNVDLVTSGIDDLPLDTGSLDAAFSTMTYHEFAGEAALQEVSRVLRRGGTFVVVDWAATGSGGHGPPVDERFSASEATAALRETGFDIEFEAVRPETFLLIATAE